IRVLAGDGTTILLTTHYLEEAAALADRVAVIAGGRLTAVDSPARLTAHVKSAPTGRWMEGDELHEEETDHPTGLIRQRSKDGVELAQLTVTRPTLEDAYLQLIGLQGRRSSLPSMLPSPGTAPMFRDQFFPLQCGSGCHASCPS